MQRYNEYAIRDFIVIDKNFKFHKWLIQHNLVMPFDLTRGKWSNISTLCCDSGIEYLKRKILTLPDSEQQDALNQLVKSDVHNDKICVLSDVLVPECEVSWSTIENRFNAFKEKEFAREISLANKHTELGMYSLFWISAKVVAKNNLETTDLNNDCMNAVIDARSLKFL